ncbi:MAG: hypothetical protein P0Y53_00245 [Candidatus Pseudobacter hemicellulosilyticus]|uniref:TIGR02646 family protein n=1 Tax=Candidatus Pseudobacter hemicellulosilyticus TaxID=3121375 RepID=A0AAJ6BG84_9BACT|nr:MAG: hypothetical protein P0Y53_00245 [Pseudobacter sp.]
MIRITGKIQEAIPPVLLTDGVQACNSMKLAYDAGQREFHFDRAIYAHPDVKAALIRAQAGKCCFCESKVLHISDGDVEHFRPKKASQQGTGEPFNRPGYYWLAYDWENLFLACTKCNQRIKKNAFPLVQPAQRALSHYTDIAGEEPLFLHPANDDAALHIDFEDEKIKHCSGSERGRITIESLQLDRSELTQHRMHLLTTVKDLYTILVKIPPTPEALRQEAIACLKKVFAECTAEASQYAGMFRAYFQKHPIPAE